MIDCTDCGSEHMGHANCGMTWIERVRSMQLDTASLETREKHNYFDADALTESFGEDAREQMLEETKGLGPAHRGADGDLYRRVGQDEVRISAKDLDEVYLNGPEIADPAMAG